MPPHIDGRRRKDMIKEVIPESGQTTDLGLVGAI